MNELARFQDLLLAYTLADPAACRGLEEQIWREYGAERAVLVLDMSGFSRLTAEHGIVHYLAMVRRMQLATAPTVASHGGVVVKFEADNAFAVFPEPAAAVDAALELNRRFDAVNVYTPDSQDIRIACGVDHGRLLLVGQHELFGYPVNRASKLGEDLAAPGEILLTGTALARLPEGRYRAEPHESGHPAVDDQVHCIRA